MKNQITMTDEEILKKGLHILVHQLGVNETTIFLNSVQHDKTDSVMWHRKWQEGLDKDSFLDDLFNDSSK